MNSRQILDMTWTLAVDHVRHDLKETVTVGEFSKLVGSMLSTDNGYWVRRAIEVCDDRQH